MRPSAAIFCGRATKYAVCRTFGASPANGSVRATFTRSGLLRWRSAIFAMRGGNVAEKSAV